MHRSTEMLQSRQPHVHKHLNKICKEEKAVHSSASFHAVYRGTPPQKEDEEEKKGTTRSLPQVR